MKRLKPIAGIVFVFVLGALTGALTAHFYSKLESARPHHHRNLAERVAFIMDHLTDDLALSAAQQREIMPIVASTEKQVQSIKDEYNPKIRALQDAGIEEIKTRLTSEQRTELDRIRAEWKRRRAERK